MRSLKSLPCCLSAEEAESLRLNRAIEEQIRKDRQRLEKEVKVLILGTGESGKSTFIKQMRIIHGKGFDDSDKNKFRTLIYRNIFMAMQTMLNAMERLQIDFGTAGNEELGKLVLSVDYCTVKTFEEPYVSALKKLWDDAGIKSVYQRRREYQLTDSAKYYLNDIDRVAQPVYSPTQQDILRARAPTENVAEYSFTLGTANLRMIDVGGQRSERRKWIQCFDNVISIIFIASLSEYDQVLYESTITNRMEEALSLFGVIVNAPYFAESSIILFLNKKDQLEETIMNADLASYFPEYKGPPRDAMAASKYIRYMFLDRCKRKPRDVFAHFTCATDTKNIEIVFAVVKHTIMETYIKNVLRL